MKILKVMQYSYKKLNQAWYIQWRKNTGDYTCVIFEVHGFIWAYDNQGK